MPKESAVRSSEKETTAEHETRLESTTKAASAAPAKPPKQDVKPTAEEGELPAEVEALRRRWKAGEFKTKDVTVPGDRGGVWLAGQADKELKKLFNSANSRRRGWKGSLSQLSDIAKFLAESEA